MQFVYLLYKYYKVIIITYILIIVTLTDFSSLKEVLLHIITNECIYNIICR